MRALLIDTLYHHAKKLMRELAESYISLSMLADAAAHILPIIFPSH